VKLEAGALLIQSSIMMSAIDAGLVGSIVLKQLLVWMMMIPLTSILYIAKDVESALKFVQRNA
jgi:hypothetical protein